MHSDFFFHKSYRDPKEYKGDALDSCNRLFMCLSSKFDELKQYYLSDFRKIFQFSGMFGIFLKCKIILKGSKANFMQMMYCITIIDY